MDASQYKDYVLVLLFIKYVSDKYAGQPFAPITIPPGASFADMVALKGKSTIGDDINKKILGPLAEKNGLEGLPDFNDDLKLGKGKEKVERLTNLIAIFEDRNLDFSKNRADGDDILGDAYEYLMRHFATESGKSKGQFYTPAEVSRIIAKIIGIGGAETSMETTVFDPTCGSGSLLLKVADEAKTPVSLYGQEKDAATSGLARMNMILHDNPTAVIVQGNTLANPLLLDEAGKLKTYDYVVANPPFSDKRWGNGVNTDSDEYGRFDGYGVPPDKNGDYAYLLHILRCLKSRGKGACILPHGVLFRGNAEADIRRSLVQRHLIKGIIGLPPNLFYGTGIPACIIVLDKEGTAERDGIFMVDASRGFVKDGNKNRLREMDIHRIVDVFTRQTEVDGYSRLVPWAEIEKNEFNLNLPRYIDGSEPEDIQDLTGHLLGGIPERDIEALQAYWDVLPGLRAALFEPTGRAGYLQLRVAVAEIKATIFQHPEFVAYGERMQAVFQQWRQETEVYLRGLALGHHPKEVIGAISEALLQAYTDQPLLDRYDVYQHLMTYWGAVMQDDCYLIAAEGWQAPTYRIVETNKKGQSVDKGWACDLVPKGLVLARYFAQEQEQLQTVEAAVEALQGELEALEEEHGSEEGIFAQFDSVTKGNVAQRHKELKALKGRISPEEKEELAVLGQYLTLTADLADKKKLVKSTAAELDARLLAFYPTLTTNQIQQLVIEDKWLATLEREVNTELDRLSQRLTQRVRELAERYELPLPALTAEVERLEALVQGHLEKMLGTVD
jgi:type I restriction enzyme M protein